MRAQQQRNNMQTDQERDLRAFLRLCNQIEESKCQFTDKPDLLFYSNTAIIGIEHTRIYREHPSLKAGQQQRAQERLHLAIVSIAHQLYKERSSIPLWLSVSFTEPFDLRKNDVQRVAVVLAEAVLNAVTNGLDLIEKEAITTVSSWEYQRINLPFPHGIKAFHYKIQEAPSDEVWGPNYGYGVPVLTIDAVEEKIQSKDGKAGVYRKRCDEVWLLLVTDLGMPSSHFRIADEIAAHVFTTQFERLFLLMDGKVAPHDSVELFSDNDEPQEFMNRPHMIGEISGHRW